jgi:hypothetical protein
VYDVNFARKLCQRIRVEDQSEKVKDLSGLLTAVIQEQEEDEEIWLRMTFLEYKYGLSFNKVMPDGTLDD